MARDLDATVTLDTIVGMQSLSGYWVGTLGCIRSRKNSRARSTSYMLEPSIMPWGVSSTLVIDAWQNTQILADSNLILEGGGAHRAPAQPDPSNPRSIVGQKITNNSDPIEEYLQRAEIGNKAAFLVNGFVAIIVKDGYSSASHEIYFYKCTADKAGYWTHYEYQRGETKTTVTAYACSYVDENGDFPMTDLFNDIVTWLDEIAPGYTYSYKGGTDIFELPVCATEI